MLKDTKEKITMLFKKMTGLFAGALLIVGAVNLQAPEAAEAAMTQTMCASVKVSSAFAYLKTGPALNYRTARNAMRGEKLTPTGKTARNGWVNVRTSSGDMYWVHRSVVSCEGSTAAEGRCSMVSVTNPGGAYMKAYPSLASRTYRIAPRGEKLNLESSGNPYEYNGWYLLRSGTGRRYWGHSSVIDCVN
jgi:hypothetical protein